MIDNDFVEPLPFELQTKKNEPLNSRLLSMHQPDVIVSHHFSGDTCRTDLAAPSS